MSRPTAVCSKFGLELKAAAQNPDAIEVVREVFAEHLADQHHLPRAEAEAIAAEWARAQLAKLVS